MTSMHHVRMLAERLVDVSSRRGVMIATAESCTGGMIASAITDISGASAVLDRGFVTYSNDAKTEMLGVPAEMIAHFGAVSAEVARAMATGALRQSRAGVAVSVTGVAGPTGGSAAKPVGLVWFGFAARGRPARVDRRVFAHADRNLVRRRATETALALLLNGL